LDDVRKDAIIGCAPAPVTRVLPDAAGRYAPVFPGWGHYHYPISTHNDSAQYYFDQGLSLYYGYHLTESLASFREASLKDSNCVMTWWGQALAMGPYYNNTYTYRMPEDVLAVLAKMRRLASMGATTGAADARGKGSADASRKKRETARGKEATDATGKKRETAMVREASAATAREKDLVAAMEQRYSSDVTDSRRPALNRAYSEAMKGLIGKYPADRDIKALYIDGVMSEHAWDMFSPAGEARPWTPELVKYCEEILAADGNHPAALHYHIHLLEASHHPEATLASAEKLPQLMPGVAHMVHMASHSFQRTGLYARGAEINDTASAAQRVFVGLAPHLGLTPEIIHYHAVEAYCALSGGMYVKAAEEGENCRKIARPRMSPTTTYLQYLYMMPAFVDVRMGKWQAILDRPAPDDSWVYSAILNEFARGLAFVRKGNPTAASGCLDSLRARKGDKVLSEPVHQGSSPIVGVLVAEGILEGEILFAEGKTDEAMAAFGRAIRAEDGMAYVEPKDWVLPARHFAGACLLKAGRPADAEKMYREDLVHNPGSGWALLGLAQSLEMQGKKGAAECRARAAAAFLKAEERPTGSVY
jgi:tetratricopeptide (TPR) repeat protein